MKFSIYLALAFFLGSNGKRISVREQTERPVVKNHDKFEPERYPHENKTCTIATDRLDNGPAIPEDYNSTNMFTDTTFEGRDQLTWEGYSDG